MHHRDLGGWRTSSSLLQTKGMSMMLTRVFGIVLSVSFTSKVIACLDNKNKKWKVKMRFQAHRVCAVLFIITLYIIYNSILWLSLLLCFGDGGHVVFRFIKRPDKTEILSVSITLPLALSMSLIMVAEVRDRRDGGCHYLGKSNYFLSLCAWCSYVTALSSCFHQPSVALGYTAQVEHLYQGGKRCSKQDKT